MTVKVASVESMVSLSLGLRSETDVLMLQKDLNTNSFSTPPPPQKSFTFLRSPNRTKTVSFAALARKCSSSASLPVGYAPISSLSETCTKTALTLERRASDCLTPLIPERRYCSVV